MWRVDDASMLAYHRMNLLLYRSSPSFCAATWTGLLTAEDQYAALSLQSDSVVHEFFRGMLALVRASLDAAPARITPEEVSVGFEDVVGRSMRSRSPSALAIAVEAGDGATPAQGCAALIEIYEFVAGQPPLIASHDARVLGLGLSAP